MKKELDEVTKQKLIDIHKKVKEDFSQFPFIKTTDDLFKWREVVKENSTDEHGYYDKSLRNERIEKAIKGNSSLELLYDWSKCYRMIDRTKAALNLTRYELGISDPNYCRIKAAPILHNYLAKQGKANEKNLFCALRIPEIILSNGKLSEQRTINSHEEFERVIVKEEDRQPWPAVLFITLLKAYGIEGKDLIAVGRKVEALGINYINLMQDSCSKTDEEAVVYKYIKR